MFKTNNYAQDVEFVSGSCFRINPEGNLKGKSGDYGVLSLILIADEDEWVLVRAYRMELCIYNQTLDNLYCAFLFPIPGDTDTESWNAGIFTWLIIIHFHKLLQCKMSQNVTPFH